MDARHLVYGEFVLLIGITLGKPFEAIVKTDRCTTTLNGLDSDRRDHAVCTGRRTTSDKDAYFLRCHQLEPYQVTESVAKFFSCHVAGGGQLVYPRRIVEVL